MKDTKKGKLVYLRKLDKALSIIWQTTKNRKNIAVELVNSFSFREWLEFAAVDVAITVFGPETGGFKSYGINNIYIFSDDGIHDCVVSIKKVKDNTSHDINKNIVIYEGFPFIAEFKGNFERMSTIKRNAIKLLLAMQLIYYHGDDLLFYPYKIRLKEISRIAKSFSLTEDYIHGLLCWLPVALPE